MFLRRTADDHGEKMSKSPTYDGVETRKHPEMRSTEDGKGPCTETHGTVKKGMRLTEGGPRPRTAHARLFRRFHENEKQKGSENGAEPGLPDQLPGVPRGEAEPAEWNVALFLEFEAPAYRLFICQQ